MFAHSRDPHPAIKLWCQVPFTKSKQLFQLRCIVCSAFWKANILKIELSMIKIGELLRKLWSLRSCFNILPPGALTPQGIEGAMKRDVSKHWCTLQWCASRGWFIAHENWTSCQWTTYKMSSKLSILIHLLLVPRICVNELGQHWLSKCLIARSAPLSYYLTQCWLVAKWTLRNTFQWKFNRNWYIFIQENAFEYVVWKMAAILSRPQCIKTWWERL